MSFKLCNAFALYGLGLPGWYGSTTSAATDVLHKTLGLSVHRYHLGDTADIFSVILSTGISLFVVCSILVSSNLFFIIGARKKVKERYDHKGIAK